MCLILLAYNAHPQYRLIVCANRDEFYDRPSAPLAYWPDRPDVLGGRDLLQGGTWLGVTRKGRLAAITNFRDPGRLKTNAPSRGHLVSDFLCGSSPPETYLRGISINASQYNGFNLIVGDRTGLYCHSNFGEGVQALTPGVHGLSNHLLDTPWPKVNRGKNALADILSIPDEPSSENLFGLLQEQTQAPDELLPHTGVDLAWERMLSPIFITSPTYGTRCSSVVMLHSDGRIRFWERTWMAAQPSPLVEGERYYEISPHQCAT